MVWKWVHHGSGKWVPPIFLSFHLDRVILHFHDFWRKGKRCLNLSNILEEPFTLKAPEAEVVGFTGNLEKSFGGPDSTLKKQGMQYFTWSSRGGIIMELQHHQFRARLGELSTMALEGSIFCLLFPQAPQTHQLYPKNSQKNQPLASFSEGTKTSEQKKQKHIICNTYRISPLRMHIFFSRHLVFFKPLLHRSAILGPSWQLQNATTASSSGASTTRTQWRASQPSSGTAISISRPLRALGEA